MMHKYSNGTTTTTITTNTSTTHTSNTNTSNINTSTHRAPRIRSSSSTEDDLSIIEHMTQTSNSITSAESLPAAAAASNVVATESQESQRLRDVEVGGEELARRSCSTSISRFLRSWRTAIRPWAEFFRVYQMGLPPCSDDYVKRVKTNLVHFLGNYFAITTLLLLCSIITSFWLLVSTIILCALLFMIRARTVKGPIKVGEEVIPSWILYAAAIFITLPMFIFAHVGYIIYCAIGVSVVLILLHATFYETQQESVKREQEEAMMMDKNAAQSELTESTQMSQNSPQDKPPIIRVTEPKTRVHFDEEDDDEEEEEEDEGSS